MEVTSRRCNKIKKSISLTEKEERILHQRKDGTDRKYTIRSSGVSSIGDGYSVSGSYACYKAPEYHPHFDFDSRSIKLEPEIPQSSGNAFVKKERGNKSTLSSIKSEPRSPSSDSKNKSQPQHKNIAKDNKSCIIKVPLSVVSVTCTYRATSTEVKRNQPALSSIKSEPMSPSSDSKNESQPQYKNISGDNKPYIIKEVPLVFTSTCKTTSIDVSKQIKQTNVTSKKHFKESHIHKPSNSSNSAAFREPQISPTKINNIKQPQSNLKPPHQPKTTSKKSPTGQSSNRMTIFTEPDKLPPRVLETKRRHSYESFSKRELEAKRHNKRCRSESVGYQPRANHRHPHQTYRQNEFMGYVHGYDKNYAQNMQDEDDIDIPRC